MELTVSFRHLDPSPRLHAILEKKLSKLLKILNGNAQISWVTSKEKSKQTHEKLSDQTHKSEIGVHFGHHYLHASAEGHDLYKTIDQTISKIRKQIQKKKWQRRRRTPKLE